MAAYAALLSLSQILHNLQPHDWRRFFHDKDVLVESLLEKVIFLQDFLENSHSHKASNFAATESLETRIRAAAYAAEDIIESHISYQLLAKHNTFWHLDPFWKMFFRVQSVVAVAVHVFWSPIAHVNAVFVVAQNMIAAGRKQKWVQVIKEMDFIIKEVVQIKNACCAGEDPWKNRNILPAATSSSSRLHLGVQGKNLVVGFDGDLVEIKTRMIGTSSNLEVVSIVGMGGIGKTTLARQVYDDRYIDSHFDIRAWVVVSQEYSLRQSKGRRYLIVMDDMWDTKIWDAVRRLFPDDGNGSRVLLTTRISDVAKYANSCSPQYKMNFLNEEDSWNLLRRKVFGEEACPLELEEIGKVIARKCGGLPLSIVVIGGLLSKASRTQEYWRSVANNLNAVATEVDERCVEILALSYYHLPRHLRACFLYMGVFLKDDIPVSKLVRLWAAEGFLKPNISKSMEEVAEGDLKDLVERSLVLVTKKSSNGKIKTCKIHDLLRDLCTKNAQKENLFHVVNSYDDVKQDTSTWRRLTIHPDAWRPREIYSSIHSIPKARSLLCIGTNLIHLSFVYLRFRLLRVLDVVVIHFHEFPAEVTELVNLRYLAFTCAWQLPPSISKLQNLETLVYHKWKLQQCPLLPRDIWLMPKLRHLWVTPSCFLDSLDHAQRLPNNSFLLENLQTLSGVRNFRCSSDIIKRIPNLRKLKISYDVSLFESWSPYQLENLITLHNLETLTIRTENSHHIPDVVYPEKLAYPLQLRKLTLSGLRLPWRNLKIIGALPNLEVLKLRRNACQGPEWRPIEGEFCQLKFLLLEGLDVVQWRADYTHFPRLQNLIIRSCYRLKQIPSCFGDIYTLELIELVDCRITALISAKQIQREQKCLENYELEVRLNPGPTGGDAATGVATKTQATATVAQTVLGDGRRRPVAVGAASPWIWAMAAQIQGDVAPNPRFWGTEVAQATSVGNKAPTEKKVQN
ncbi:UNVERIFIED_CONTAM: putative late blight resistance proteinR1A-4 [Sesamum latifolium]|uniref:Late blight resistance proteinR1A-4 n=1 Tax=Sesamum latifolium TaxID=2727402 RepID=A0AAW2UY15_9LAMI